MSEDTREDIAETPRIELTESPGQRLRRTREAAGLEVARVATELRLETRTIEALEQDRFDRLPPAIFVRGYLRAYGELLELPVDELLEAHARLQPEEDPPLVAAQPVERGPGNGRMGLRLIVLVLLLLVVVGGVVWWLNSSSGLAGLSPGGSRGHSGQPRHADRGGPAPGSAKAAAARKMAGQHLTTPVVAEVSDASGSAPGAPASGEASHHAGTQAGTTPAGSQSAAARPKAQGGTQSAAATPEVQGGSQSAAGRPKAQGGSQPAAARSKTQGGTQSAGARSTTQAGPQPGMAGPTTQGGPQPGMAGPATRAGTQPGTTPGATRAETRTSAAQSGGPGASSERNAGNASANAIPPARRVQLALTFRQKSWVEVHDARQKRLLYTLVPAGHQRTLVAEAPVRVFLGNAPGVRVSVNGQPYPTASYTRPNNTARFVLKAH
ncbi:MAG TPA: RodZ domain-containing protein [Gammaproteobacteria bacterium]|nr:RodZ domain-containing protein [Gammaproteobacteria bacterium]